MFSTEKVLIINNYSWEVLRTKKRRKKICVSI